MLKVLFINNFAQPDYLSNMLYIGLAGLDNVTIYTYASPFHLIRGIGWDDKFINNIKWEGIVKIPGFTVCGKVERGPIIDFSQEIKFKIENNFYDKIIFSSIWRDQTFLDIATKCYKKRDLIFIDGDDHNLIENSVVNKGIYFKRELYEYTKNIYPVSMAIPDSMLCTENILNKGQMFATVYPGKPETYIFKTEKEYYNDYLKSYYGITFKKGGWDCMRHYEILCNKCIPYFIDLENCPEYTMVNFPKNIILKTNKYASKNKVPLDYECYLEELFNYTKNNLTTSKLANYIIETAG